MVDFRDVKRAAIISAATIIRAVFLVCSCKVVTDMPLMMRMPVASYPTKQLDDDLFMRKYSASSWLIHTSPLPVSPSTGKCGLHSRGVRASIKLTYPITSAGPVQLFRWALCFRFNSTATINSRPPVSNWTRSLILKRQRRYMAPSSG